jgi:hypothetical protein
MPQPPSADASRIDVLRGLWTDAGLEAVETREITVQRSFADFDDLWANSSISGSMGPAIAGLSPSDVEQLKARVSARLPADAEGRITYSSRANAVRGRVPMSS